MSWHAIPHIYPIADRSFRIEHLLNLAAKYEENQLKCAHWRGNAVFKCMHKSLTSFPLASTAISRWIMPNLNDLIHLKFSL